MARVQTLRSTQGLIADAICDLKEFQTDSNSSSDSKRIAITHLTEAAKLVANLRNPVTCTSCNDMGWRRYQLEPNSEWITEICSCEIGEQIKHAKLAKEQHVKGSSLPAVGW